MKGITGKERHTCWKGRSSASSVFSGHRDSGHWGWLL